MQIKLRQIVLAASVASAFAAATSYGQAFKTEYDPGDLILGFQVDGGSQILEVNLGVASLYRDRTTNLLNIVNLGTQLNIAAFGGANWFSNTSLYFGIAGMRSGTASDDSGTATGDIGINDPNRTLYFTKSRATLGTVGLANSAGVGSSIAASAGSIFPGYGGAFDGREVNGIFSGGLQANGWEDRNPITSGVQGTSFGAVNAGIQQAFGTVSGTYGAAGSIVGVVDLWRDSSYANAGVPEFLPVGSETYQGSFTIDNSGNVSYIAAVPEPSSVMLLGSAALLGGFIRRRRNA